MEQHGKQKRTRNKAAAGTCTCFTRTDCQWCEPMASPLSSAIVAFMVASHLYQATSIGHHITRTQAETHAHVAMHSGAGKVHDYHRKEPNLLAEIQ